MAKAEILKLNPKRATIHAVIVVPMFAPKITEIDCPSEISPAFTNETTITVVAPDDWIIIVRRHPVRSPVNLFPVMK